MGLTVRFEKMYKLKSGRLLDIGDMGAYYWHDVDMRFQKCCYFLCDYAMDKLKRPDGTKAKDEEDYYGEWVVPMKNIQDIISRCNKALKHSYDRDNKALTKLFKVGGWHRYDFEGYYNDAFFDDVRELLSKLPVILEDIGDPDVVVVMSIG